MANTCERDSTEKLQKSRFRSEVVICNWRMNWKGFVFKCVLLGLLFLCLLSSKQLVFLEWQSRELFGLDVMNLVGEVL